MTSAGLIGKEGFIQSTTNVKKNIHMVNLMKLLGSLLLLVVLQTSCNWGFFFTIRLLWAIRVCHIHTVFLLFGLVNLHTKDSEPQYNLSVYTSIRFCWYIYSCYWKYTQKCIVQLSNVAFFGKSILNFVYLSTLFHFWHCPCDGFYSDMWFEDHVVFST